MDPTANLKEQLELAKELQQLSSEGLEPRVYQGDRLAELVIALHEWIQKGGFLPHQWSRVGGKT